MPSMTMKVMAKEAPQPGRKRGRVKNEAGMLFQASPAILDMLHIGKTYDINYKDDEFNGNKFRVLETFKEVGGPPLPSSSPNTTYSQQGTGGHQGPTTSNKDMHIFVCGAYNNAIANPNVNPFDLTTSDKLKFVTEQMEIYNLTLGRKGQLPPRQEGIDPEFNDEIPY